ncbi:MAG: hypothetical protein V4658_09635 [Bacteroidota bacterium]
MKKLAIALSVIIMLPLFACKAKKCPTFDGANGGKRVEYKKNGLVRKRNR